MVVGILFVVLLFSHWTNLFGRLLDEIITIIMIVNYLIMWKKSQIETCIWKQKKIGKILNKKPLSCKYSIHIIISWFIDDLNFFFMDLQLVGHFKIKKSRGTTILKKKMTSNTLVVIFVVVKLLLFISSKFWKILYYFLYIFISSWTLCTNNKQVVVELMKLPPYLFSSMCITMWWSSLITKHDYI
jgi:hypothetical protein